MLLFCTMFSIIVLTICFIIKKYNQYNQYSKLERLKSALLRYAIVRLSNYHREFPEPMDASHYADIAYYNTRESNYRYENGFNDRVICTMGAMTVLDEFIISIEEEDELRG